MLLIIVTTARKTSTMATPGPGMEEERDEARTDKSRAEDGIDWELCFLEFFSASGFMSVI